MLRAAFEKGADTDTLAAMTGGLMGCLAGAEWIPRPWLKVQDAEYIQWIAGKLISESGDEPHSNAEILPNHRSILSKLDALNGDKRGVLDLGDGKQATATVSFGHEAFGEVRHGQGMAAQDFRRTDFVLEESFQGINPRFFCADLRPYSFSSLRS